MLGNGKARLCQASHARHKKIMLRHPGMPSDRSDYETWLGEIACGKGGADRSRALIEGGLGALRAVSTFLERSELSIDAVERVEDVVKATVLRLASGKTSLSDARDLALAMKRIGFFHKLKSYAVKAASPLGYSIFFQRPGEGFSFQRHIAHKIEIFHILSAPPGGYALVCDYDAWQAVFDPSRFQRWLEGAPDPDYERFRHIPEPGDMIVIDRLNVVHTVIGCSLEEFATISTDMVDRLFDQNIGRPVPPDFARKRVNELLRTLPEVEPNRIFELGSGGLEQRALALTNAPWGESRSVRIGPLTARHIVVRPGARTSATSVSNETSSLFVRRGHGTLTLMSGTEAPTDVEIEPGDLTLIPARVQFVLRASSDSPLRVSQQSLPLETAFGL